MPRFTEPRNYVKRGNAAYWVHEGVLMVSNGYDTGIDWNESIPIDEVGDWTGTHFQAEDGVAPTWYTLDGWTNAVARILGETLGPVGPLVGTGTAITVEVPVNQS